jgi:6-phosphogluconate dehydrogenase (decarboxylating)
MIGGDKSVVQRIAPVLAALAPSISPPKGVVSGHVKE